MGFLVFAACSCIDDIHAAVNDGLGPGYHSTAPWPHSSAKDRRKKKRQQTRRIPKKCPKGPTYLLSRNVDSAAGVDPALPLGPHAAAGQTSVDKPHVQRASRVRVVVVKSNWWRGQVGGCLGIGCHSTGLWVQKDACVPSRCLSQIDGSELGVPFFDVISPWVSARKAPWLYTECEDGHGVRRAYTGKEQCVWPPTILSRYIPYIFMYFSLFIRKKVRQKSLDLETTQKVY